MCYIVQWFMFVVVSLGRMFDHTREVYYSCHVLVVATWPLCAPGRYLAVVLMEALVGNQTQ